MVMADHLFELVFGWPLPCFCPAVAAQGIHNLIVPAVHACWFHVLFPRNEMDMLAGTVIIKCAGRIFFIARENKGR
jgi:hypothetical protein